LRGAVAGPTRGTPRVSAQHAWSMPFGTAPLDSGGTRFRLWAPDQRRVHLALDDAQLPMQPVGEGWFERDCDVSAGTRYRFRLEDGTAVPDPASRAQPDGVDGA